MAECGQAGLLAALLLFTVLTLRDVYVGRSSPQQVAAGPEMELGRAPKATMYSGPVLKFQYCVVSYLKLASILLIVGGQNVFAMLAVNTPRFWTWTQDNKIFSCLMAFFLCNMMETHFLSTGAFEVTLDDVPIWSKLESGYVPNIQEIFRILHNHLNINRVDGAAGFTSH